MNSSTDLSLPTGFRGIVTNIGVKDSTDDLVIVATDGPVAASGVFTQSRFVGPSVLVSREHITWLAADVASCECNHLSGIIFTLLAIGDVGVL